MILLTFLPWFATTASSGRARARGAGLERLIGSLKNACLGLGASDPRAWRRKGRVEMEGVHDSG